MSTRLHASSLYRPQLFPKAKWFFKDRKNMNECISISQCIDQIVLKLMPEESYIDIQLEIDPGKNIILKFLVHKPEQILQYEDRLEKIKSHVLNKLNKKITIHIEIPKNPHAFPRQIAIRIKQVIMANKKKGEIIRAIRQEFMNMKKTSIQGIRIVISGKYSGSSMARTEIFQNGNISKNSLSTYIDEYSIAANTTSGTSGIRVTIATKKQIDFYKNDNENNKFNKNRNFNNRRNHTHQEKNQRDIVGENK